MTRIRTLTLRRLDRLRRRGKKQASKRNSYRSSIFFEFDARLRIAGVGAYHSEITEMTVLTPSHAHLQGEPVSPRSKRTREEDLWLLESPLGGLASLDQHIEWIWNTIRPHADYLKGVISKATWADLMVGCLSEIPYPVISLEPASLEISRHLGIGITFNFTC